MTERERLVKLAKAIADLLALGVEMDTQANIEENPQLTPDQARAIAERQTQEWLSKPSSPLP